MSRVDVAENLAAAARLEQSRGNYRRAAELFAQALKVLAGVDAEDVAAIACGGNAAGALPPRDSFADATHHEGRHRLHPRRARFEADARSSEESP
jgi:hypothetical protein